MTMKTRSVLLSWRVRILLIFMIARTTAGGLIVFFKLDRCAWSIEISVLDQVKSKAVWILKSYQMTEGWNLDADGWQICLALNVPVNGVLSWNERSPSCYEQSYCVSWGNFLMDKPTFVAIGPIPGLFRIKVHPDAHFNFQNPDGVGQICLRWISCEPDFFSLLSHSR